MAPCRGPLSIFLVSLTVFIVFSGGFANAEGPPKCPVTTPPVIGLDLGSRYEDDDASRSDIDEDANNAVNKALKPLDSYVRSLASLIDDEPKQGQPDIRYACLYRGLKSWADANALSDLGTLNAKLAVSPRLAGISITYYQATQIVRPQPEEQAAINHWLEQRAIDVKSFFSDDAPQMASHNNLRAWAGLAVGQIGVLTGNEELIRWGAESNQLVICSAESNGSLPLEMKRGDKALHYQLHAIAPLVVNAAVLNSRFKNSFAVCDGKLDRIVDFTVTAINDPTVVGRQVGKKQTFTKGKEKLEGFQIAWLEPYLRFRENPKAVQLVKKYRPLTNSMLGGNLTKIYDRKNGQGPPQ
jgi:poly(beta-D-mannuronate) lyase